MNPEVQLEGCMVIAAEERAYTKKDGAAGLYRGVVVRYGGRIFKFTVSKDLPIKQLQSKIDTNSTITVELSTFGDSLEPELRVIDVE